MILSGHRAVRALTISFCLLLLSAQASAFSAIYVFGDSLSDAGNIFDATGTPTMPYFNGQFSNGDVWAQSFAANLGLSATASRTGGTNYAHGGAQTGPVGAGFPPSLLDQKDTFLSDVSGVAPSDALYVVFGGGNDVNAFDTSMTGANIGAVITDLEGAGATEFLVLNIPDVGLTPDALDSGLGAIVTSVTELANIDIAAEVAILRSTLGVNIIEIDAFQFLQDVVDGTIPTGFTNFTERCIDAPMGTDCNTYLFWDGIHPTGAGHALLADIATQIVPVPPAVILFSSALALLGWCRRRVGY